MVVSDIFSLCHAPRERVSWNLFPLFPLLPLCVTLHVSVWVEIHCKIIVSALSTVTLHVSVWVEILNRVKYCCALKVTLHVSVWVEIHVNILITRFSKSRSTWACELKYFVNKFGERDFRHAPRERVSWNSQINQLQKTSPVTLHVSVWVEIPAIRTVSSLHKVTLHVSVWVEIYHILHLSFPN